jgi:hypothetical protein
LLEDCHCRDKYPIQFPTATRQRFDEPTWLLASSALRFRQVPVPVMYALRDRLILCYQNKMVGGTRSSRLTDEYAYLPSATICWFVGRAQKSC